MEWLLKMAIDASGFVPGVAQAESGVKVALDAYEAAKAIHAFLQTEEGKSLEGKITKAVSGTIDLVNGKPVLIIRNREDALNALDAGTF